MPPPLRTYASVPPFVPPPILSPPISIDPIHADDDKGNGDDQCIDIMMIKCEGVSQPLHTAVVCGCAR